MARLAGHRRQQPEPDEPDDEPSEYEQRMLELAESQEQAQWRAAYITGRIWSLITLAFVVAFVVFLLVVYNHR